MVSLLMKINNKKTFKYIFTIFAFVVIFIWAKPTGQHSSEDSIATQYDQIVYQYEMIKKAEQSDLKEVFLDIVKNRLKCYSANSDYSVRLSTCRKAYQYALLRAARENIKSSPSLGDFMLCIQNCPLAYSFCNGEELSEGQSKDCLQIEILCIESCLDKFWRGNSLSDTIE